MTVPLNVLVVDAERAAAEAVAASLGAVRPWSVRGATGALEALRLMESEPVGVLVVAGVEEAQAGLVREVARRHPTTRCVLLTGTRTQDGIADLVRAGVRGWAHKEHSVAHLARVVDSVADGEWWLPRHLMGAVLTSLSREADAATTHRLASLTLRERQVLVAMSQGLPREEIAQRLRMSVNTLRTHVQHLLSKLEVHNSLEAVSLALREGVTAPLPGRTGDVAVRGA